MENIDSSTRKKNILFRMDSSLYFANSKYPYKSAKVLSHGYRNRGRMKIANIELCPFRYYPLNNILVFYSTMYIQVEIENKTKKDLNNVQFSFDIVDINDLTNAAKELTTLTESLEETELIIVVTSEELEPYFENYAAWKRRKGYNVKII